MRFFIKEWPDDTVTLLTEDGRVIWNFDSKHRGCDRRVSRLGAGTATGVHADVMALSRAVHAPP